MKQMADLRSQSSDRAKNRIQCGSSRVRFASHCGVEKDERHTIKRRLIIEVFDQKVKAVARASCVCQPDSGPDVAVRGFPPQTPHLYGDAVVIHWSGVDSINDEDPLTERVFFGANLGCYWGELFLIVTSHESRIHRCSVRPESCRPRQRRRSAARWQSRFRSCAESTA